MEIIKKSLPENHPNIATSYCNLGNAYYALGDIAKAISFFEKSSEIYKISLPSDHQHIDTLYNNLGAEYFSLGEAIDYYEKGLEISKKKFNEYHPRT